MTHKEKFEKFHSENPEVWELFEKFALDAVKAGFDNYSTNTVIERIRWHTDVETKGDRFKINNNHAPYYARMFHNTYPELQGFFRTRTQKAP